MTAGSSRGVAGGTGGGEQQQHGHARGDGAGGLRPHGEHQHGRVCQQLENKVRPLVA